MSNQTRIPTQQEYHNREIQEARHRLEEIKALPVRERKENAESFGIDCANDPALIAERIRWLLDGNYGYGPMIHAQRALEIRNPKPTLFYLIGNFEWSVGDYYLRQVWKNLGQAGQQALNVEIDSVIAEWKEDQKEN